MHYFILATLVGSGLIAGAFFAFSSFIMAALARTEARRGIEAMQAINITVINWHFLGVFVGTALLSVGTIVHGVRSWGESAAPWLVAGGLLYLVGTFIVTGAGNVPLNDSLAEVDPAAESAVETWEHYLVAWTRLNTVRTVAAALATICFAQALR